MGMRLKFLVGLFLFVLLTSSFTMTALADSPITVTITTEGTGSDGECSLREAVQAANNDLTVDGCTYTFIGGDDVVVLTDTTYTLTLPTGLNITSTMIISGAGSANTVINGNANSRVITNTATGVLTVTGLSIVNGRADRGGGIQNFGTLVLSNTVVSSNTAILEGGGIYNQNGMLTLNDSTVSLNTANGDTPDGVGGGISNLSSTGSSIVILNNSKVMTNTVNGVGGGGISNNVQADGLAQVVLNSSLVSGNVATHTTVTFGAGFGGGIRNSTHNSVTTGSAILTLNNSTVGNNSAFNGGGIGSGATIISDDFSLDVTLNNSTVSGNVANGFDANGVGEVVGNGGGIVNQNGSMRLINSTVSGNAAISSTGTISATGVGGGMVNSGYFVNPYVISATLVLTNTTVTSNTGATDIANLHFGSSTTTRFNNSILAGGCEDAGPYGGGTFVSDGYNLEDGNTCNLIASTDITNTNPLLQPLANNSGDTQTQTHALQSGSWAIDTGDCVQATDQRGQDRPNSVTPFCDIGAYESEYPGLVDLAISKSANTSQAYPGQTITYTLVYTNNGPAPATGVLITDVVPATLTNVVSTSSGAVITPLNSSTWSVADLAQGAGGIIMLSGNVRTDLTNGETFENTATITSSVNTDSDPTNDEDSVTVIVPEIDLHLNKTATDNLQGFITTITYTLAVSNPSTYPASGVVVSDTLPSNVNFVSSSSSDYNDSTGVWDVQSVPAGNEVAVTVVVTAALEPGESITNTAEIIDLDQVEVNTANNTASAQTIGSGSRIFLPVIMKSF